MKWALDNKIIKHVDDLRADMRQAPLSVRSLVLRGVMTLCRIEYRLRGSNKRALRQMGSARVSLGGQHGQTLLHTCCGQGSNIELLEFLIEHNADLHAKNGLGLEPLDR